MAANNPDLHFNKATVSILPSFGALSSKSTIFVKTEPGLKLILASFPGHSQILSYSHDFSPWL